VPTSLEKGPAVVRRAVAELLGTAFLLAAIVGSGIMAERLAGGNGAVALLANAIATGAALATLILTFGPISGAHLNPVVTLGQAAVRAFPWSNVPAYLIAQIAGAFLGVAVANSMFGYPMFFVSQHARSGFPQILGEFVATFGLLVVIWSCTKFRESVAPFAIAAYITAAYWFTSSTSFANPAVTLAREASNTFAGIRPIDVPGFIAAQLAGSLAAAALCQWLLQSRRADRVTETES